MRPASLQPLVLCYHSVSDEWQHALAVTRRSFERQVTGVAKRFEPLTADQLLDGVRRGFHVTFDDAYRDILEVVPFLERLGVRATIFVATGFADGGRPLDIVELADEVAAYPQRLATMGWDELRELAERGCEIGSHTVSHPHLTQLTSREIEAELADSRGRLEAELNRPCRLLAYPFGEHEPRVHALAAQSGYAASYGLWTGTDPSNRHALPRIDFYRRDTLVRERLKTSFVKPYASRVLWRLRGSAAKAPGPTP
jgi:peptidoglycan/xylan/chitin deacetylase (PgdA/CDA1 family)